MNNFDRIFRAIETITGSHLVALHDEARGYVFKRFNSSKWERIDFDFANSFAGFGYVNESLI